MKTTPSRALFLCALATRCNPQPAAPRDTPPPRAVSDAATREDASALLAPSARLTAFGSRDALLTWVRARRAGDGAQVGDAEGIATQGITAVDQPTAAALPTTAAAPAALGGMAGSAPSQPSGARARPITRGADRIAGSAGPSANPPGANPGGSDSITNNQVEGVDEGDIVKMHGDHLVVLRRGRLFSVRLGDEGLTPVSMVDAYGRGRAPGSFYDEMLVDGDTIVVIGFSGAARSTEVGLFDIDAQGAIRWRDTLYVRSSDYYSSRNYASRLVGHRLVMYMPVPVEELDGQGLSLPAIRHRPDGAWESVVDFGQLYRPVQPVGYGPVIHTVMSCDLARRGFACRAAGVIGPAGRNFYVSGSAVYLWVPSALPAWGETGMTGERNQPPPAVLFRMPLDGREIGAVKARGAPLDQFSFDEHGDTLRVVVRSDGRGEGMWGAEGGGGDLGLLRVPVARFNADMPTMQGAAYRGLPRVEEGGYGMQNRFVGDHLLYGAGQSPGGALLGDDRHRVQVFDLARERSTRLDITHTVERLEPLGRDALVVGNESGGLTFTAVALDERPALAGRHTVRGASQGESRSHGFFFSPSGDRQGMLGLPVTVGNDGGGWNALRRVSSSVVFLAVNQLQFRGAGSLRSGTTPSVDDHCVASCADWYGNARPIFWRGRTFALLGYELVEGTPGATVRERRRVDFLRALLDTDRDRSGNVFNNLAD
jgi:hypothetical protein